MTDIERVKINGKAHIVPKSDVLKRKVHTFLKENHQEEGSSVDQHLIRNRSASLYYQLGIYGYTLLEAEGKIPHRNQGRALRELGFTVRRFATYDDIRPEVEKIIPLQFAEQVYDGQIEQIDLRKFFMNAGDEGVRIANNLISKRRKDTRLRSLENLIDSLYPELAEQYETQLSFALTKPLTAAYIGERCRTWFFSGEDLSRAAMRHLGREGRRIQNFIYSQPLPTKTQSFTPGHTKNSKAQHSFSQKVCSYMGLNLDPTDVVPEYTYDAVKYISLIGERSLLFLLSILQRYDPHMRSMTPDFKSFFPQPIHEVITPRDEKQVQIKNGEEDLFADGRVKCGRTGDILIEVKNHKRVGSWRMYYTRRKYSHARQWVDGNNITGKILLLNSFNGDIDTQVEKFQKHGWSVMRAEAFTHFYRRALDTLLEHDPDFFQTGVPLRDDALLLRMNELAAEKAHILLRRGQTWTRRWMAETLDACIESVTTGKRCGIQKEYKGRYIRPFTDFAEFYGERVHTLIKDCLMLDLETAGLRNQSSPIVVLGLAYLRDGKMVTDQRFIKNPFEEEEALRAFEKKAEEFSTVVTFNGSSFDIGYTHERMIANLLPRAPLHQKHVDMREPYRRIARAKKFPHATLQVYEGIEFNFKRKGDISGEKIPQVYHDYLLGKEDVKMGSVLRHNAFDLITLALLYAQYGGKKK